MARNGFGSAWNRILNAVGLVDVDEEPQRGSSAGYEEDRYGYGGQRSSYTPSARRNDRPQQNTRRNAGSGSYSSRSGSYRSNQRDAYSEWNTAPRSQNRYADSIYDDDTTLRGSVEGRDDNEYVASSYRSSRTQDRARRASGDLRRNDRYEDDFDSYEGSRSSARRSAREPEPEERRMTVSSRQPRASRAGEVVVYDIRVLEDCREVIYALLANKTVVFTVEEMDNALIRRVVDTLSGAACALDATIRKTSDVSFLIAPASVEVNGTRRTVERRY